MYVGYMLHDPIANNEKQITIFDPNYIARAFDAGLIVIGITEEGKREVIKDPKDVVKPAATSVGGVPVVLPSYVDSKVLELVDIIGDVVLVMSDDQKLKTAKVTTISPETLLNKLEGIRIRAQTSLDTEEKMLAARSAKISNQPTKTG